MTGLLLGVDGGNTKTIALLVGGNGAVEGVGAGGCSDIHGATSPEHAVEEIVRAVGAALSAAGASAKDLAAATFSLAGADWPEDFELLQRTIPEQLGLDFQPLVVNDAIGAIRSGTDDGVGVSVVCGTGGAVGGRGSRGEFYHLGFWPDGTGAAALGSEALAAVWRASLGVGPETSLTQRALERWGRTDPIELLHAFTRLDGHRIPGTEKALFADAVLDEAASNDAVARTIVARAGERLGDYARICADRTGHLPGNFPLVLCGGVLRHSSTLLSEGILARVPTALPVRPSVEPVAGAVLLAGDRVGRKLDLDRLRAAVLSCSPRSDDEGC